MDRARGRVPSQTASQKVELYIKEALYNGELRARERIIESELAMKVGCSRAPAREAVLRLVREGLLVTVPRRGTFVRDFTPESIEEIFHMRAKLEGLCVRYMRQRMTAKAEGALRDCLKTLEEACRRGDQERFLEADMRLHRTIWKLSGCPEVERTLNSFMIPYILMVARSFAGKVPLKDGFAHHKEYVEMVLTAPTARVEHEVEEYFMRVYRKFHARGASYPRATAAWLLHGSLD